LTGIIREKFEVYHRGRDNAIKRFELLEYLQTFIDPKTDEREMREGYESLPLCGDRSGLYLPASDEERESQIECNKKKIRAYAKEIKSLKRYQIPTDPIQKELFS
jgi:hypothetical protein